MPAELLDDRAVHRLATPQQVEPNPLLGDELPDCQARARPGSRRPSPARSSVACENAAISANAPREDRRDEIQEADPEEPDQPSTLR